MGTGEGAEINVTKQGATRGNIEITRGIVERAGFGFKVLKERLRRPDWAREERENKARRGILQNVLIDRQSPPLPNDVIEQHTKKSISRLKVLLGDKDEVMIGQSAKNAVVFTRLGDKRYVASHFADGELQTLAAIDLSDNAQFVTRVIFNNTHEGRLESSREKGLELTRTAVHAFNFLVKRGSGTRMGISLPDFLLPKGDLVPPEIKQQIERELEPPAKLTLGEELFQKINDEVGRPLENGGVFIIADTALGNLLASPFDRWRSTKGVLFSRYSEIDDFMNILACRGDKKLAEQVKAFGHTSRGSSFTQASIMAANIGNTEVKPVFPGYNPYLQHNGENNPFRPSPAVFGILELGKAQAEGKSVTLVDEAPTTERVYATAIQLAKERGIDISRIPTIFMVAVNETGEGAELIDGALNFNYSMGDDCKRGFQLALEHFQDITLFTPQVGVVGIPLSEFKDFAKFMTETGIPEYQRVGEIFELRANDFASSARYFEGLSAKTLGKPLGIKPGTFASQDTLIGAYIIHPEWFVVKEMPLRYKTLVGEQRQKEKVKVVTGLTEEGKEKFRSWLWSSIKANFV